MKARELQELTVEELERKLNELRTELFNLRLRLATGDLENPMRLRLLRKDVARVMTLLRSRGISPGGAPARPGRRGAARR
ncbi:MAG: 50S ribosomal protein L29 [Acetobacteraceae bacterium]|nr:50S ribosomal protein L29 [Acetobacteraceae bacterium]